MAQAAPQPGVAGASAADFYRLTPDANGSYVNGTWSHLARPPTGYAPDANAEAVLGDGRALFVGGEYNQDNYSFGPTSLTNMSAVYDPVANSWQMIAPPPGLDYIGDVPSTILPDGRFVFGTKLSKEMWSLNPATLTWTSVPAAGKNDIFAEEGFTLLPGGTILTTDVTMSPLSEHYVPAAGTWVQDGPTPVQLTSPTTTVGGLTYGPAPMQTVGGITYGPAASGTYFPPGEVGPAVLRPDGTVFATGSALAGHVAHTAIYHPGASAGVAGTWTAGPDMPAGEDADDASAALLINGNVLVAGTSGALYEFDGASLRTTFAAPPMKAGAGTFLLPLPNGQTLVLSPSLATLARVYVPLGSPLAAWAPTILSVPTTLTRGGSFALTGTQLNGLSEAAALGDEFSAATNYPLVRLTNVATGHVFYARTHGHTMGVATGSAVITTMFDIPATTESGPATLVVTANGIPSMSVSVVVG